MKKAIIVLSIFAVLTITGLIWWKNGLLPVNTLDKTPKIFLVNNGDGVREIANNLKTQNLIKDPIVFFLLIKKNGFDKQIQAGNFRLNSSMSAQDIAENLTHGILDIWVTVPEGLRATEINTILQAKIPSYQDSWMQILQENEGYLFPDTYLIPKDADINLVISLFKNNFNTKYESLEKVKSTNLTKNQTIIMASMIEREAKNEQDRPLVASVIYNRLSIGMKLDIDATIQYALGYQINEKRWWKKGLTLDDLTINSSFNTYRNAGLPPTPISNPGASAIKAALNPSETDYLFYMTDGKGVTHYAKTIDGHNANIETFGL